MTVTFTASGRTLTPTVDCGSCSPSDIDAAAACTENCFRRNTRRMVIMSIIGVMFRYAMLMLDRFFLDLVARSRLS